MEQKINGLIDIIKFLVEVDRGLSKSDTEWILSVLNELQENQ